MARIKTSIAIDEKLKRQFHAAVAADGEKISEVLERLIARWLEERKHRRSREK